MKKITVAFFLLFSFHAMSQLPVTILPSPISKSPESSQPDSVFRLWKSKLQTFEQENNKKGMAVCLQNMAQSLYHLGNFSAAIEKFLQADKIFRSLKEDNLTAGNLNLIGTVYYYNQQPIEALRQFNEALSIYKNLNENAGLATTFSQIGHYYEKTQQHDSAHYFQRRALTYAVLAGDKTVTAKIYENIGSIYEDQLLFDSARHYFQMSLLLNRELGNYINQVEVLNNLGDLHRKKGEYDKGLYYARAAMNMAIVTHEKYQLQSAYRDIALNFHLMNKNDSAYHYLLLSRQLVQDLYSSENSKQITLFQALYDTENKNAEIAKLNAIRKTNILFNIAIVIGAVLLALLAIAIFSKQKQKIKNEMALNERNEQLFLNQKELMDADLKMKQMEEENLKQQLELKGRELSSHLLHLIQKNETMEELKKGLTEIIKDDRRDQKKQVRQLLQKINVSFSQDTYWNEFRLIFDQVHQSFFTSLNKSYPALTASELRLLSLLKMNLASADVSTLLGITPDSLRVMRYRIKKKIGLQQDESLSAFIQTL